MIISFNIDDFPKIVHEFYKTPTLNWITFLQELGYRKFRWNHLAVENKYVEMDETEFTLFALRWP
jgi:hypothetical protein